MPVASIYAHDALAGYKFYAELDGIVHAWFTECNGLTVEVDVEDVVEGGQNQFVHKLLAHTKYPNLVLRRGYAATDEFWAWYKKTLNYRPQRRNMSIILYSPEMLENGSYKEIRRWNFVKCMPIKWIGPEMRIRATEMAFESIEIVHEGMML